MPMRKLILALAPAVLALVIVAVAGARTSTYVGPQYFPPGNGGSSSYSNWFYNFFSKSANGYDTMVTFIDNVTYSWHRTVRNTSKDQYTYWSGAPSSMQRKGHCLSYMGGFNGSCWVAT
jgi:hypothetical protein